MYIFTACIVNTVLLASTPTYEDRIIGTEREQEQRPTDRKTNTRYLKQQLLTSRMCIVHETAYMIFALFATGLFLGLI
jgi:hypothetical protein